MSEAKSFLSPEADGSLSEEEEKEDKNKTNSLEVRIMLNNNIYDTLKLEHIRPDIFRVQSLATML